MDYDETKSAAEAAWQEVLAHPMADLRRYLTSIGVELRGGTKPTAKQCPICEGKDCFSLLPGKDGGMIYKCHHAKCESGGEAGGIEKFIQLKDGCDWKTARATLHKITGIRNPWDDFDPKAGKKKKAAAGVAAATDEVPERSGDPMLDEDEEDPPVEPPADAPVFIHIPDLGRNVYEEAWLLLSLSAAHRKELGDKRGLSDGWIHALGFRTSRRGNRELLQPLLDKFPVNELLRSGIATRDRREWKKLVVSDQLCGKAVMKDKQTGEESYGDDERVIIPYIDDKGRIVGLRPHKMGLTNRENREDQASEFYDKNHHSLRIVYGEHFLVDRPERHEHRVVICEGEHKAQALAYCGIPAIGFQGIEYLWQNRETGQAERHLEQMLRKHKIREVVVVFDHEDKSQRKVRKPKDYFIAEIWARYTALKLENLGFKALYGMLPDAWMEDGKADWDSRLAYHLREAKGKHDKARAKAAAEFERFITDRSSRKNEAGRRMPPVVGPVPRQVDAFPTFKEDVINQELNRLNFEPECFKGGKHEIQLAAEISGHCHPLLRDFLGVAKLAQNLRKCFGGFYVVKAPSEKVELRTALIKQIIRAVLEGEELAIKDKILASVMAQLSEETNSDEKTRGLRAALDACNTILYRNPDPFSDFTIVSQYKVLVTEADGALRKDRLCVFIDANGRKSRPVQIDWSKMSSAQEARKVFGKLDGYHFSGGQNEIDPMVALIDVDNYQQTIVEIDTYGQHRDSGIYLLGDIAWADNENTKTDGFLFPDKQGIIWHDGIGYKNSEALDTFCHKPPLMFPGAKSPREAYEAIDWIDEQREVQKIWSEALNISYASFGDYGGYGMVAGILQYLAHPETLSMLTGKPGLFVQGAKGSGKTTTIGAFMRMLGYVEKYGIMGLSGTKVGIERSLSQFDCLPVHIDEWRNNRASDDLIAFITNAFNGLAVPKGTAVGSKSIRLSRAATTPIITGEDMTSDPALLSRYMRLTMASASRTGTPEQQKEGFMEMLNKSKEFYRIGRFLMRRRRQFGLRVVEIAKEFAGSKEAIALIRDDRACLVTGICLGALRAAQEFIMDEGFEHEESIQEWFLHHGKVASTEIEKDIFRLRWFTDCVSIVTGDVDQHAKNFLHVRRGNVIRDEEGNPVKFDLIKGNLADAEIAGNGRLHILVAANELFASYEREQARKRATVPINIRNIQNELRRERCWVSGAKCSGGQHRFRLDKFYPSGGWWVMDYEASGDLKEILRPIYEQHLFSLDLELDDSGKVVRRNSGTETML